MEPYGFSPYNHPLGYKNANRRIIKDLQNDIFQDIRGLSVIFLVLDNRHFIKRTLHHSKQPT